MLLDAAREIERLAGCRGSGLSELRAAIALCRLESDALPFTYARPGAPLSGLRTPAPARARVFRHEDRGGGELLLSAVVLDADWLSRLDLRPSNEAARRALAEELAPALASNGAVVLSKPGTRRGAAVHRTGKYATGYQLSYFDQNGFSRDEEVASLAAGLLEATRQGFTAHAPTLLDEMVVTEEFATGNERADVRNGSLREDQLHTVSVAAMRRMDPHEFSDLLGRVAAAAADPDQTLAGMLARWDGWNEANPPDSREVIAEHDEANREALAERVRRGKRPDPPPAGDATAYMAEGARRT